MFSFSRHVWYRINKFLCGYWFERIARRCVWPIHKLPQRLIDMGRQVDLSQESVSLASREHQNRGNNREKTSLTVVVHWGVQNTRAYPCVPNGSSGTARSVGRSSCQGGLFIPWWWSLLSDQRIRKFTRSLLRPGDGWWSVAVLITQGASREWIWVAHTSHCIHDQYW